jgi:hypothetical protein
MSGDIKAKIGTKLSETEQKALDPKKVGKMQGKHPKADVEAQYTSLQVCPYCSCVGYSQESPTVYLYFTCHCCGRIFKA